MPNSYIGINDVARKIAGGYIGVNGIARKITKAYIGDENGLAKLIYQPQNIITFNSSIAPTSWTEVTTTQYTATNTYGTWVVTTSSAPFSDSTKAYAAFDNSDSTLWRCRNLSNSTATEYIQLDFPILINPTDIRAYSVYASNANVELLDTSDNWVNVGLLTSTTSAKQTLFTPSYSEYFKAIRTYGKRYSSSYKYFSIYDLKIRSGTAIV